MIGFFSGLDVMHKEALEKDALHITSALYTVTTQAPPAEHSMSVDSSGQLTESLTSSRRIQRRRSRLLI
jgi:hypothetical protein